MKNILCGIAFALANLVPLQASDQSVNPEKPGLLPTPQKVQWSDQAVKLEAVEVVFPKGKFDKLQQTQLELELKELLSRNGTKISSKSPQKIIFRLGQVEAPGYWEGQADEAYEMVTEQRGAVITANTSAGLYHGLQTLRQLIVKKNGETTIAVCKIHDFPAFKIRGVMHDVGRNFQSLDQLRMQIDVMAAYKYNIFHWHLSDHYGWRLESKKYPELQSEKAFTRDHGKFYTQAEFKEMSDYCWARGITIIPEFDSPGHSGAFRQGLGIKNMKDPKAIEAMTALIDEICTLADEKRMPYFHIGTDEVRHADEYVDADYLPALHEAVHKNGREVIGWWHGMAIPGDTKQIQQTWAQFNPMPNVRHIDSRSNYVNHMESLDFATRMMFQQPCRVPHGDEIQLGGIIAIWPDTRVEDKKLILTNNPVLPVVVAYSEAVWKGIAENKPEFWAKIPPVGTPEFAAYTDFEDRIAEQRDRFLSDTPFNMVKTYEIEWRLLGPVAKDEVPELEQGIIKDHYEIDGNPFNWTKPLRGGAIHIKHFFGFGSHLNSFPAGKDIVWANTHVFSPVDQEVDAWINFNTISSSDDRAGAAKAGNWNANPECNIWLNGKRIEPPTWKSTGNRGLDIPLIDEVYTSRPPTTIKLNKGWNTVLVKSAPTYKWVFSFSPIEKHGDIYREVEGLKYSATPPQE